MSWPPLAAILRTEPLSFVDWALVVLAMTWPIVVLETVKAWRKR